MSELSASTLHWLHEEKSKLIDLAQKILDRRNYIDDLALTDEGFMLKL